MSQKTKKQHYVPQFYLNTWKSSDKLQVNVYDKELDTVRINNIRDVASERFFYDISLKDVFSSEEINTLKENGFPWNDEFEQTIEKSFSEDIERPFSELFSQIIEKAHSATQWVLENCFFLSEEEKYTFAVYLTFQYLRTKRTRNLLLNTSKCLEKVLHDMKVAPSVINQYTVSQSQAKFIHLDMLLDTEHISKFIDLFNNYIWLLALNRTKTKLYTSDNPIGTRPHIIHPQISGSGLASKGVEVFFPVSPDLILIMLDRSYHTGFTNKERRYTIISSENSIKIYNAILAAEADRFVFSSDGDMTTINQMKDLEPDVFRAGQIQISWGGNTYLP